MSPYTFPCVYVCFFVNVLVFFMCVSVCLSLSPPVRMCVCVRACVRVRACFVCVCVSSKSMNLPLSLSMYRLIYLDALYRYVYVCTRTVTYMFVCMHRCIDRSTARHQCRRICVCVCMFIHIHAQKRSSLRRRCLLLLHVASHSDASPASRRGTRAATERRVLHARPASTRARLAMDRA